LYVIPAAYTLLTGKPRGATDDEPSGVAAEVL